jgi:hypothetical protein
MIPEKKTAIEQRAFLRGYQKFEIRADGNLEVTVKRLNLHNQFKFPLWHLNPSPTRKKFIQVGSLAGAIIFGLICVGFIVAMLVKAFARDWGFVAAMAFPCFLFGIVFCACLWKLQRTSINANVFFYRDNNRGIYVWHEKPDAKTFNDFCEALTKAAEEAWNNRKTDPSPQSLAGELAALKKLKDDGVLSDADFEKAKEKLINSVAERKIGFNQ